MRKNESGMHFHIIIPVQKLRVTDVSSVLKRLSRVKRFVAVKHEGGAALDHYHIILETKAPVFTRDVARRFVIKKQYVEVIHNISNYIGYITSPTDNSKCTLVTDYAEEAL